MVHLLQKCYFFSLISVVLNQVFARRFLLDARSGTLFCVWCGPGAVRSGGVGLALLAPRRGPQASLPRANLSLHNIEELIQIFFLSIVRYGKFLLNENLTLQMQNPFMYPYN